MRLRFPEAETIDRETLKPKPGDAVWYENTKYIVVQVGLKWLTMHKFGENPNTLYTAKVMQVYKDVPKKEGEDQEQYANL